MKTDDINLISAKLKDHKLAGPSRDLDNQINTVARQQAEQNRLKNNTGFMSAMSTNLVAIAASLVITLGLFFMMHQAIQPPQSTQNNLVKKTSIDDIKFISADDPKPKDYRIARPEMELIAQIAPTQQQRNGILRTLELPKADDVIAKMELAVTSERSHVESELSSAFSEIESLIVDDNLRDARSRYYDLVQSCQSCELPAMLELLMIDSAAPS